MNKTVSLLADLFTAVHPAHPDPLERYAALMVLWGLNPLDVACRDLLVPGGKNSLPTPSDTDWPVVVEHKQRWERQIKEGRA